MTVESRCKFKNDKNECEASINNMQCAYTNRSIFTKEEECGLFEQKENETIQLKVI